MHQWEKENSMSKKAIAIIVIICAAAAAALLLWKFVFSEKDSTVSDSEAASVVTLAELNSQGGAIGAGNRFAGVVEAQETWSVRQNPDSTIKEVLVSVGDEVKKGDALFVYDIEKYRQDQEQAEIDLERLNNELAAIGTTIEQLQKDQKKAKASEQADYTIRIQDAELQQKQKELDIRSKTISIEKLKENQANATVVSEIDGVVRTINDGSGNDSSNSEDSNSFITVMKTENLRIKGTINEQNIGQIMVGNPVIVHSRVDDRQTWKGTVSEINTDSAVSNQSSMFFGSSDSGSSSYNFYVALDNSDGMMIGQHVYLEADKGQADMAELDGVWIPTYFLDMADPEHVFVWADNGSGRLEKREIKIGEMNEDLMMAEVTEGLTEDDAVAFPDDSLTEGMATNKEGAA